MDELPSCISNYSVSRWKNNYNYYCSTLQQESLLAALITTIPAPRTRNIQNLCFYFKRNTENIQDLQLKCIQNKVTSVIEIEGMEEELINTMNDYLKSVYNRKLLDTDIHYFSTEKNWNSKIEAYRLKIGELDDHLKLKLWLSIFFNY
jgi:hypothetical protein